MRTILYCFAGRRPNMELQLPFVRRVLEQHPEVEYHCWNLTHTEEDDDYLRTVEGERITVIHRLSKKDRGWIDYRRMNEVWQFYTSLPYRNTRFVKIDDDVVFFETDSFGEYLENIRLHGDRAVVSATVINNGASLGVLPEFRSTCFEPLDIPLLDVHLHGEFAQLCHELFFDTWESVIGGTGLVCTEDWLSINMIGYTWPMQVKIASKIGKRAPGWIAGRTFPGINRIGDEGAVNIYPRLIDRSMVAGHLTFGPQVTGENKLPPETWNELRGHYAVLGKKYLEQTG